MREGDKFPDEEESRTRNEMKSRKSAEFDETGIEFLKNGGEITV